MDGSVSSRTSTNQAELSSGLINKAVGNEFIYQLLLAICKTYTTRNLIRSAKVPDSMANNLGAFSIELQWQFESGVG